MPGVLSLARTAWRHRTVLVHFVLRDLRVKYRGTVFGYLWSLLEPLSLVLIYWFVFVVVARRGGPDYPLVVVLGVLPYQLFSQIVQGGAASLVGNAALIRRVYLPRELFVLGLVGSATATFLLSLIAVVPFLVLFGASPGWGLWLAPLGLLGLLALATGLALGLACLNAVYRDVGYVLRVLTRLAFYASPVIYPVAMVPEALRAAYLLNPLALYLNLLRSGVMGFAPALGPFEALWAAGWAVGAFLVGVWAFRRWEAEAVKFL